ncbi:MAG: S1C family serine protease [Endozoicomonas sp.]
MDGCLVSCIVRLFCRKIDTSKLLAILPFLFSVPISAESIDYKKLYQDAAPAVVLIVGVGKKSSGKGTGSVLTDNGLILTNAHVVTNDGKPWDQLLVAFKPDQVSGNKSDYKKSYEATVIYSDAKRDLALIIPKHKLKGLQHLQLSDLKRVDIGEPVVAIGHPGGGQLWTMTTGRISASWADYRGVRGYDLYQTETAINPGNSGGPLLAGDGSIVGVNTFVIRNNKQMSLEGLNYAIKSTTVANWLVSFSDTLENQSGATGRVTKNKADQGNQVPTRKTKPINRPPSSAGRGKYLEAPKIKPSKRAYKSTVESGLQITEDQLMTSFLNDIHAELNQNRRNQASPADSSRQRQQSNPDGSSSSADRGLDVFLESIY